MPRVSDDQLQQIRDASNIVDIVSDHVRLKKKGRNHWGLCPFHNEKSPSFSVLEDKGIFKCFGCGKAGDVFSFVMQIEALTFMEAIERLAKRANITLVQASPAEAAKQSERETAFSAVRECAGFFYRALRSELGAKAAHYLNTRDISKETQKKFGLGFAPDTQGSLLQALEAKGVRAETLEKAGLIMRNARSGDWYERFHGRVIFPVFDPTGRIIGFGGRILPDDPKAKDTAKYINSPDTEIYHKSRVLYGLFQAKDAIRKNDAALLVEGYLDVIALSQAGFEHVVAASGTSLTNEQLNLLKRYTSNIVLLFDADQAGRNAAMRGIELALEADFNVNVVVLPKGEDPDSYIRANGADAFKHVLDQQQSFIEAKAQWFDEQGALHDPVKGAAAVESIVESIVKIPSDIRRNLFLQKLSQKFGLRVGTLEDMMMKRLTELRPRGKKQPVIEAHENEEPPSFEGAYDLDMQTEAPKRTSVNIKLERSLLESIVADPDGVAKVIDEFEFSTELIADTVTREIVEHILLEGQHGVYPDYAQLRADFQNRPTHQRALIDSEFDRNEESSDPTEMHEETESVAVRSARYAIQTIMSRHVSSRLDKVRAELNGASEDRIQELMEESLALARQLDRLREMNNVRAAKAEPIESPREGSHLSEYISSQESFEQESF